MIDIQNETLLSLTDATKSLPRVDGKRPHTSTLWRWCRRGLRGVRLEHVRVGNRVCTSAEALNRFVNALAAADQVPDPVPDKPTLPANLVPSRRDEEIRRASAALEKHGI